MEDKSRKGPSGRLRFEREEQAAGTSGQLGPKSKKQANSKKEADGKTPPITNQPGASPPMEQPPTTSGQLGPKSGKLRQDSKNPRPSERLWRDGEPPLGGEAAGDGGAPHTGPADKKAAKNGTRMETSKLRMEKSGEKLNTAREKLAAQKPPKKPGLIKTVGRAAKHQTWRYVHGKIHQVERENVGIEAAH